jgi:hypothetical protein
VKTGHHNDPLLLKLKEYSVRETMHTRTSPVAMDNGELEWIFGDC